ncbi:hypothetical protein ACFL0Q_05310, partial [Thermodesulfobacteriota bacterium]
VLAMPMPGTAMEHILSDEDNAKQLWAQAVAQRRGSELKLHFFYWIVARSYGVAPRLLKESEAFVENALKGMFCADTALDCIATLGYANLLPGSVKELPRKAARVERYLARGEAYQTLKDEDSRLRYLLFEKAPGVASPMDAVRSHFVWSDRRTPPDFETLKSFLRRCAAR